MRSSLSVYPKTPTMTITKSSSGPTLPKTAPNAMSIEAEQYEAAVKDF